MFAIWHAPELSQPEPYQVRQYYQEWYLNTCSLDQLPDMRAPLKLYLLCVSDKAFHNTRVMPFLFSMSLIPLTYLLANRYTKDYRCGLLASSLLLGSKIVGLLGTTASFSSDWAVFFLASLYVTHRMPYLVGPLLLASVAAKGLTFLMLPAIILLIYKSETAKRNKWISTVSLGVFAGLILGMWLAGDVNLIQQDGFRFHPEKMEQGIFNMYYVFRHDGIMYGLIPLAFFNLIMLRKKSLLFMTAGLYSLVFLLPVFSVYDMYDYRMIPFIVFCCIGASMTLKNRFITDRVKNHIPYWNQPNA